ncbi:hypothetical protein K458DRAFT_416093 [Lentithecium fluviatile CBS 122367]|uniref:Uncharacterized protein n=1 Tax=Lentithecium fluviatile CBS 122367 TaxID=1168545 RepID=A0A6G1J9C8_9PLEO|nr:hypothetical protein K458DRAFT_416093 [Lentithecium fluviatile CBS 122367]
MSPYVHQDSMGNPYQVPGRNTPIPPPLWPGHNAGRRVSFASPPAQAASPCGSAFPPEHDAHRYRARSASVANAELHFNHPSSSYDPIPQYFTQPRPVDAHQPGLSSQQQAPPPQPKRPDFLIIGLFALRLTKKLIRSLDRYPERDDDVAWINRFLRPYTRRDALGRITGDRIEDYVTMYPAIIARFIRQPRYPVAFMEMNPDKRTMDRALTDEECMDIVDFADAAGEWGSTVKLPGMEAERIERLAERRRMAHF